MIGVLLLAALLLLTLAIYIAVRNNPAPEDLPKNDQTEDHGSEPFDAAFQKHIAPHTNKYFHTKIAGASFPNADGGDRLSIIKKCEPMELLRLELDSSNPFDRKAIGVKRVDGSQLGYLERAVASGLHRDTGKPWSWSAIFKQANRDPTTEQVVGAVIVLTRSKLDPEDT